jgi:hypothetical protein
MSTRKRKEEEVDSLTVYERRSSPSWHHQDKESTAAGRGETVSTPNAMIHGVYASQCLTSAERHLFDDIIERFHDEYELNSVADFMQLDLVCLLYLHMGRAIAGEDWDKAERLDTMLHRHLSDIKATKHVHKDDEIPVSQVSPVSGISPVSEWRDMLLQKVIVRKKEVEAEKGNFA